jgi:site-specific DNA-adenine methylase
VFQSNFGYLGKSDILSFGSNRSPKVQTIQALEQGFQAIQNIKIMCIDFREALSKIAWSKKDWGRSVNPKEQAFLYADPPYCQTGHNYHQGFTEQDTRDLFEVCVNSGLRFGISEFDTPFIRGLAQEYQLYLTEVCERQTLKSRNTEVLITNYEPQHQQIDLFTCAM